MNLKKVLPGEHIPEDIYVIIEIPYLSYPIKYEINKNTHTLFVDRFIPTPMLYPFNYGYINNTLSEDNDPLDVLVLIPFALQPKCVIQCKPVGILKMIDESGIDSKIIAVPTDKICTDYHKIKDIDDISDIEKNKIIHFFKHYKDLEKNKWVKITGFEDSVSAKFEIQKALHAFIKNK